MATIDEISAEYTEELEATCALAIDARLTKRRLVAELVRLSVHYIGMMYTAGGGDVNSAKGKQYLQKQTRIHRRSAAKLTQDIFRGKYYGDNG